MNKSKVLEKLFKEIIKIVEHCEKNKEVNLSYWWWDDRKYSRARFKRLRLMIDEMLKDIER